MNGYSEVNFEKRGKLEDHQACPVCQCCVCWCGHFKIILLLLILLFPTLSLAAEAPYNFQTLDISVPGHPGLIAFPEDIGDSGKILSNIRDADTTKAIMFSKVNKRKIRRELARFGCSDLPFFDTVGESINRRGDIVGSCIVGGKQVGFLRFGTGFLTLLDFPGADGTSARGISNNGKITGQFFGPLDPAQGGALSYRFHCFTFDQGTNQFTQIDFPLASTFVDCSAVNRRGQILVRFNMVTAGNDTIEQGFAILDNGNWDLTSFPRSLEHIGGPAFFVADLNNLGQAIIEKSNGDEDWNGLALFDDGQLFEIPTPEGWLGITVGGMNNLGEFVGAYLIQVGVGSYGQPIFERHGFIAVPAP